MYRKSEMMSCVFGCGRALPEVHRETVAGETSAMFATSIPFSPPRSRRSSMISATALGIVHFTGSPPAVFRFQRCGCGGHGSDSIHHVPLLDGIYVFIS